MPNVIALTKISYDKVTYAKGDTITMKDKHARQAILARIASPAPLPPSQTASTQDYATRHMEAQPARTNWNSFTVPELKQQAKKRGIEFPTRVTKGALIKLLKG